MASRHSRGSRVTPSDTPGHALLLLRVKTTASIHFGTPPAWPARVRQATTRGPTGSYGQPVYPSVTTRIALGVAFPRTPPRSSRPCPSRRRRSTRLAPVGTRFWAHATECRRLAPVDHADRKGQGKGGKRGQAPFVRSTRGAVPAKGAVPFFRPVTRGDWLDVCWQQRPAGRLPPVRLPIPAV